MKNENQEYTLILRYNISILSIINIKKIIKKLVFTNKNFIKSPHEKNMNIISINHNLNLQEMNPQNKAKFINFSFNKQYYQPELQ